MLLWMYAGSGRGSKKFWKLKCPPRKSLKMTRKGGARTIMPRNQLAGAGANTAIMFHNEWFIIPISTKRTGRPRADSMGFCRFAFWP